MKHNHKINDKINDNINKYLLDHLYNLKNNKIGNDYKQLKIIEKKVNNYLDNNKLFGGSNSIITNLDKINRVVSLYNDNNKDKLIKTKKAVKEINNSINSILKRFENVDLIAANHDIFLNEVENYKTQIVNEEEKFKINTQRNMLFIEENFMKPLDKSSFDQVFETLNNEIKLAKKNKIEQNKIDEIIEKIDRHIHDAQNLTNDIGSVNEPLQNNITSIENDWNYQTNNNDNSDGFIAIFQSFNNLTIELQKIKSKNNNSPEIDFLSEYFNVVLNKLKTYNTNSEKINYYKSQIGIITDIIQEIAPNNTIEANKIINLINLCTKLENTLKINVLVKNADIINEVHKIFSEENKQIFKKFIVKYPNFYGDYSIRIDNNLLKPNADINNKVNTITNLLTIINNGKEEQITDKILEKIYNPDMKAIKMTGGSIDLIEKKMTELLYEKKRYDQTYNLYKKNVNKYNKLIYYSHIHTMFLLLIVTNQLINQGSYPIYKFINKGLVDIYKRSVVDLYKSIVNENSEKSKSNNIIAYMRKYHYATITTLANFLTMLSGKMDARDLIDIESCTGKIAEGFLLFNYFKNILDGYKEIEQNKVTIYARINDIDSKFFYDMIDKKVSPNFTQSFLYGKMFASDYDRLNMFNSNNAIANEGQLKYNNEPVDTSIMYVRSIACNSLNKKDANIIKFTEVFDTDNYVTNEEISSSMVMHTQLGKGKGIAVMTYGYSGTGKTYTLFGKKEISGEITDGLLQSTLKNIKNLESVKFRLYEIYGYGLTYPHYWEQGQDKIGHTILSYNYDIQSNYLKLAKEYERITIIPAVEIGNYSSLIGKYSENNTMILTVVRNFIEKFNDTANDKIKQFEKFNKFTEDFNNLTKDYTNFDQRNISKLIQFIQQNIINQNYQNNQNNQNYQILDTIDNLINKEKELLIIINNCNDELKYPSHGYKEFSGDHIHTILNNFKQFTDEVEMARIKGHKIDSNNNFPKVVKTIRDTPNNVVSSRSTLIYDFQLKISGIPNDVTFLIIDLPGREEISQTYIEPYFENPLIQSLFNNANRINILKLMTLSMAQNPIALPIFELEDGFKKNSKGIVIDTFLEENDWRKILEIELPLQLNEINKKNDLNTGKQESVFEIDGKTKKEKLYPTNFWGETINYKNTQMDSIVGTDLKTITSTNLFGFDGNTKNKGKYALASIHIINRLLLLNRFDILEKIYEKFCNKYINTYVKEYAGHIYDVFLNDNNLFKQNYEKNLKSMKGGLYYSIVHENLTKKNIEQILMYDYYLTPLEGVYINENIVGLIRFLAEKTINKNTNISNLIEKQDMNLAFITQQKKVRTWMLSNKECNDIKSFFRYDINCSNDDKNIQHDENNPNRMPYSLLKSSAMNNNGIDSLFFNFMNDRFHKEYNVMKNEYKSDKIYNFDEPLIQKVLEPSLAKISDYKVFYLFGNYQDDNIRELKCAHQYKLFDNTKTFIKIASAQI
jgi:hypothetical protein